MSKASCYTCDKAGYIKTTTITFADDESTASVSENVPQPDKRCYEECYSRVYHPITPFHNMMVRIFGCRKYNKGEHCSISYVESKNENHK